VTRGRPRIHLDASEPGRPRRALCGWLYVDTTADVSSVTCKACLTALQRGRPRAENPDVQLIAALAPTAGPPPRLTPQLWAASCRGGELRRCGACELCAWERQVAIWAHAAPWTERAEQATEGRPRWANANAALLAYAAWLANEGGYASSALGGLLDRLKRGQTFTARGPVTDARDVRAVVSPRPTAPRRRALVSSTPAA
jgi:hypothetical protein